MPSTTSVIVDSPVIFMFLYDPLSPNCVERTNALCSGKFDCVAYPCDVFGMMWAVMHGLLVICMADLI